ncbi:multiple monosaccharide ABC transporter substrate-binding protein [Alkalicoccus urumqiensis]|uniref:Sugar ABC transporter substrate-binding protein n=1 Tax=Alkalicoccus urumqiensis TaxID=1548213 RepID=A0A2P6MLZ3_ALKUR|nr:multiple monosaccharide ABC transporter substrate-binding protein [Alkalicoccus urumqiensis]PRO67260.1 sugar ABC transporter substrate-binding protein [Alkalicoccus urumqiensis]
MKKALGVLSIAGLGLLAACGGGNAENAEGADNSSGNGDGNDQTVGLAMPTQSSERWVRDGENMQQLFEDRGYDVEMQYGEDDVETQVSQIENMITQEVDLLVIASIDGEALTSALEMAEASDIPVVSYDRLIMNSDHVSYYATFDNFQVGVQQGEYIEEALSLGDGEGPYNIELFAGSPDDNNAYFFWDGAMSVLEPYIEEGQLVVQSEQTDFEQASTLRWDGALAQERMDNILSSEYSDGETVDVIYSPFDGISRGVISSLENIGYGSDDLPMPVITGQDAEEASVRSIINDNQTMTIFKDTRALAEQAVNMGEALLEGEEPEVNDTETYDNGVKVVPSYLLEPEVVDKENYEEVLIDSGYYSEEDLQ